MKDISSKPYDFLNYFAANLLRFINHKTIIKFLLLFSLIYFGFQLLQPIRMADTDMWYHLNGGRYFWQNFSIPKTTFFSYIAPEREWVNYYWGFQAIIYKVYLNFDYHGLVALRAIVSALTILIVGLILNQNLKVIISIKSYPLLYFLSLSSLFLLITLLYDSRATQLRPHLFSYFFIALFIYISFYNQKYISSLPIFTIFWANIHGIEWPAGAAICGSLFLYILIKSPSSKKKNPELFYLLLCAPAFLINPYFYKLFLSPFFVPEGVFSFTRELESISIQNLLSLNIDALYLDPLTLLTLIFYVSIFGLYAYLKSNITNHFHYLLIYLFGLYLLSRGQRFIWEWLILALPIISYSTQLLICSENSFISKKKHTLLFLLILIVVTFNLYTKTLEFKNYPFDKKNLPVATAQFFKNLNLTGKLLSWPNHSGYLEWELDKNILHFIDMQYPPFTPLDLSEAFLAFNDYESMKNFIAKHNPDWILASTNHTKATIINNLDKLSFYPIYTENNFVLFANSQSKPSIISKFKIEEFNPITLKLNNNFTINQKTEKLIKILASNPENTKILRELTLLKQHQKNLSEARSLSNRYIKLAPYDPDSYYVKALIEKDIGDNAQAILNLLLAESLSDNRSKKILYRDIAITYFTLKKYSDAYEYFKKSIKLYNDTNNPSDLYIFAISSVIIGDISNAKNCLNIIVNSSENSSLIYNNSLKLLHQINSGEFKTSILF